MKKLVQGKKHKKTGRIQLGAPVSSEHWAYKEQLKQMSDKELVQHRRELIEGHDGLASEYWKRMWSVNAEMANRFSRAVREEGRDD